ncbi:MAG: DUF1289 domain-containing protein [Rhodobacteraceae bacterium]|nr:DUF1289 domain-containing protein [Paracoccaceae bacterium]
MSRSKWKRREPDSPCQQICLIHSKAKICIGCHRTAEEVRSWARFSPEKRQRILGELPDRAGLLKVRRRRR